MSAVYLELRTECPRCLLRVPINGISQTTKCARCGEFLQLAPEAVLSAIVRGREGQIGLFGTGVYLTTQLTEIRRVVVEQQKDVASLQGQLKALIQGLFQDSSPSGVSGVR